MQKRRAFTVIEVLVALVMLGVGLAAFARAAAGVARLEQDARLQRLIAATIQARLDSLSIAACGTDRAGSAAHDGIQERWRAAPRGRHLELDLQIDVLPRPARSRRIAAVLPCTL